jgi:N-acetylglucosamine kinase-like BadF-type ATPase
MSYYIGLDGGGTKTKCLITDENLNVLHQCTGGPSNFLMIGTDEVSLTLYKLIYECIETAKCKADEIAAIVIGTTGAGRRTDAEKLENDFINFVNSKNMRLNNFRVESDARIALEGAFPGSPGAILIAGTGSIMFGKDRNGNVHRVGGFGRFIGDEGSGYDIGRRGLIAVAKDMDGRGLKTSLTKLLNEKFNIDDVSSLITEIYKNKFDIASVAPLVTESAENGDEICENILNDEAEELILHIRAMAKLLKENETKLCLIGSTLTTENYYSKLFHSKVKKYLPYVTIQSAEHEPAIGAILMAKS